MEAFALINRQKVHYFVTIPAFVQRKADKPERRVKYRLQIL
jgi:hypothetical protein